jgi:hypothetical protein
MVVEIDGAIVRDCITLYKSIFMFWQVKIVLYSKFMDCYSGGYTAKRFGERIRAR